MRTVLDRKSLLDLLRKETEPALTITMPAHRMMPDAQKNPIRFKNLLERARRALAGYGLDEADIARLTERAGALVDDYDFWQHQRDGLAVFADADSFRAERLPARLPESVRVGRGFAVKPFLRLLEPTPGYYVLAAAWESVRLFEGGAHALKRVEDDALPETIMRFAGMTEVDADVNFHTSGSAPAPGAEANVSFHGLGTAPPEEQEKLQSEFARELAKQTDRIVNVHGKKDLVLVADERLCVKFMKHTASRVVRAPETLVSPAGMDEAKLHQVAGAALEAERAGGGSQLDAFSAPYGDSASQQASTNLEDIATAALAGRIADLFVDPGREVPGRLDEATGEIAEQSGEEGDASDDLADALARLTLKQGGAVHAVSDRELPDGTAIAALHRY
jgi:hypothetical protein